MAQITDVLAQLKIPFCLPGSHHHVRQGWIGVDCPWCPKPSGGKGKWKLGIEVSTGRANCWTCGGHSLLQVLTGCSGISQREAQTLLGPIKLKRAVSTPINRRLSLPIGLSSLEPPHRQYLKKRGLDPEEVERLWKLQGIGIARDLSWRIFIPIHLNGATVSWTTRGIGRSQGYISARPEQEAVSIKKTLYGIDLVRTTIIICEGPGDVWSVGPGAVATFGVMLSHAQIKMIARFPTRLVCFDSDDPGQRAARVLVHLLSGFPGDTRNVVLDAEDPGSASRKEIRRLRRLFLD